MNNPNTIAVCCQQDSLLDQARTLARELSLPLLEAYPETSDYRFLLVFSKNDSDYQLELHFPSEKLNPLLVNYHDQQLLYRQKYGGGRQQAIAKAAGLKRGYIPKLLDATAGLGKDAFILASLNCEVTLCERNPVIHSLLEDGLRRLTQAGSQAPKLTLHFQNSFDYIKEHPAEYDVIYLDPMYPHRTKSALVKKEMRILRDLVGDDTDFDSVLAAALQNARQRVVVKRPKNGESIGPIPPTHSIESKKTRYDVYLTQQTS